MAKIFGLEFSIKKDKSKQKVATTPVTDDTPSGVGLEVLDQRVENLPVGEYQQHFLINPDALSANDIALINQYRNMALYPDVDLAIDDIVNETVVVDHPTEPVIKLNTSLLKDKESDELLKSIEVEFEHIINAFNFNTKAYDIFRQFYIDGRLFYHILIDDKKPAEGIQEIRFIDPRKIVKVKITPVKNVDGVDIQSDGKIIYLYNPDGLTGTQTQSIAAGTYRRNQEDIFLNDDSVIFVHSGKFSSDNMQIYSYLHPAIRPYNQLRILEDAFVIYRVARAPERRIFNVDVGNLPRAKAEEFLKRQMDQHKTSLKYDSATGEVRSEKKFLAMLEDFWFPKRDGRGTEVETLSAGDLASETDDKSYFQRKLFRALKVPFSRVDMEVEGGGEFRIGETDDISREEIKYSRFVARLRNQFNSVFDQLLEKQLLLKKIISSKDEWKNIREHITYDYARDNHFRELLNATVLSKRLEILGDLDDYVGKYFSHKYVLRHILQLTESEIDDMRKEIELEKGDKFYESDGGY